MTILRDYQQTMKSEIYQAWNSGHKNVLAVAPTGSGKTALKAAIIAECRLPTFAIAHRQELVGQISNAVAESGVYHRIIAPKPVIKFCIAQHIKLFGRSYHHAQAPIAVAGVDTLNIRADSLSQLLNQTRIWDIDEAHHVLTNNKWGKAVSLFPNAFGLGVTATPTRTDRKSLSRKRSGLFDYMVVGPSVRNLIDRGYLSDYIVYGLPPSIDISQVTVSETTGEFNQDQLRKAAHRSTITGDIVEHYLRIAAGKRGITFVVDVEMARETADAFKSRGIRAEAISANTPDIARIEFIDRFRNGALDQLVNVDLFGEGFDVPAVEVVSLGRPTWSLSLHKQQMGRCMRPAPGKTHGIIIDHAGNITRPGLGLPDKFHAWSLDDEEPGRRKRQQFEPKEISVMTCVKCFRGFEAFTRVCPFCGHYQEPGRRDQPEFVEGDLVEYSPELLASLGKEIRRIDGPPEIPSGVPGRTNMLGYWAARQNAQRILRQTMEMWGGIQREVFDRSDSEIQRQFYFRFGIDVMTAQTLNAAAAEKLTHLIREELT